MPAPSFGWTLPANPFGPSRPTAAIRVMTEHIGDPEEAVPLTATWPTWQHASVQRALDAYVAEHGTASEWFGLRSQNRAHMDFLSLLADEQTGRRRGLARAAWTESAVGPATMMEVLECGVVCTNAPDGSPIVVGLRTTEHTGPGATIDVLAQSRETASAAMRRIRDLVSEHDVVRGQFVQFGYSEHYGNAMVTFLPRPEVTADQVILPDQVLATIEHHVLGVGAHADELHQLGIHLKRGLLLYGPPGTGKTHTVRYLIGRTNATVLALSGEALSMIDSAAALARRLTPSIVVVEDVDLIAQDRSHSPMGNPLLFTLLDTMDGIAADADVTFILTTNRVADLEEALVQRPGRVDLAVEIPRPDADGRARLVELYRGQVPLDADPAAAIAALDGVTASAIKEIMRRCTLRAVAADARPVTITQEILDAEVERFNAEGSELTRSLLGG